MRAARIRPAFQFILFIISCSLAFASAGCRGSDKTAPPQGGVSILSSPKHSAEQCPPSGVYAFKQAEGQRPGDAPDALRFERSQEGAVVSLLVGGGRVSTWRLDGSRRSLERENYVAICAAGEARIESRMTDASKGTIVRLFASRGNQVLYSWGSTGSFGSPSAMARALYEMRANEAGQDPAAVTAAPTAQSPSAR